MAVHTRYVDLIDDLGSIDTSSDKTYYFESSDFSSNQIDTMKNIIDEAFKWIKPDWDTTSDKWDADARVITENLDPGIAGSANLDIIRMDEGQMDGSGWEDTFTHELGHNLGLSHPFNNTVDDINDLDGSGYDHWHSRASTNDDEDPGFSTSYGHVDQPNLNEDIGQGGRPDTLMRYGYEDGDDEAALQMSWMDVQALRYKYGIDKGPIFTYKNIYPGSDYDFGSNGWYKTTTDSTSVELFDDNNLANTYTIPEDRVAVYESEEPRGELDGIDDIVFAGDVDEFVFKQRGEELSIYGDNKQAFKFETDGYSNNPDLIFDDGGYDVDYTNDGEITVGDVAITGTFDPTNADAGEHV